MIHVLAGVVANARVILVRPRSDDPAALANRLRATTLYWYFVDVVWLLILVLLYVV
jgi:heme/copper-type cytochrome/quinol oxidase subunit 3